MSISAASPSQSVSAFASEGIWLSVELDRDSFVRREDVYGRAPAGRTTLRSGDARPRYLSRPSTPASSMESFPVTPQPLSVVSLEVAYGVQSPLDQLVPSLYYASAIRSNVYSQDSVGLRGSLPLYLPQDWFYAGQHDDAVPAVPEMGPLYHPPATKVEFHPQHNGAEASEVPTFSQSKLSLPVQRAAPATDELWKQMPMALDRSIALIYRPENLWDAGPHRINTSKPLPKAKTPGVLHSQHNGTEGSEASKFSQSNLSLPAPRAAPATDELWKQMPMALEHSIALLYQPEDLWDAGPHHIDTSKPLPKAKTPGVLSRLCNKLLGTKP